MTTYSSAKDGDHEDYLESSDVDGENDLVAPKSELEKVRLLFKGREAMSLSIPRDQPQCKVYQIHCKFCKQTLK